MPLDLKRSFESTDGEMSYTKPLTAFPPDEWPPCPDCGGQLTVSSVGMDDQDELIAAQMICYRGDHDDALYVYEAATESVYFAHYLEVKDADWSEPR